MSCQKGDIRHIDLQGFIVYNGYCKVVVGRSWRAAGETSTMCPSGASLLASVYLRQPYLVRRTRRLNVRLLSAWLLAESTGHTATWPFSSVAERYLIILEYSVGYEQKMAGLPDAVQRGLKMVRRVD
jgi:hypothetical protein